MAYSRHGWVTPLTFLGYSYIPCAFLDYHEAGSSILSPPHLKPYQKNSYQINQKKVLIKIWSVRFYQTDAYE